METIKNIGSKIWTCLKGGFTLAKNFLVGPFIGLATAKDNSTLGNIFHLIGAVARLVFVGSFFFALPATLVNAAVFYMTFITYVYAGLAVMALLAWVFFGFPTEEEFEGKVKEWKVEFETRVKGDKETTTVSATAEAKVDVTSAANDSDAGAGAPQPA